MTLYIVPVIYDILYRREPLNVQIDDDIDRVPDDAAAYLEEQKEQPDGLEFLSGFSAGKRKRKK